MVKIQIHKTFKHNCEDGDSLGFTLEEHGHFIATTPYVFHEGQVVEVPEPAASYFIAAGWAAREGEEPLDVPKDKVVYVEAHSGKLNQSGGTV